ncbi:hypothetical protein SPI_02816 [Niveomyces insectorum RCEF 264]|uniref:ADF-H domain-containing protein n=1 Tax=Niveomyces insectorum RCEF 264 TaxID=1081102 RepID=A0A167WT74_9HYPO|nr:hypothetical protein SPI_02816 [Niveomyces insectorum RCEF 264]
MSLNGLDDSAVKEAYEAAVSEPGGWFLLKYASRDEIGLLGRGNGGIVEMRNAIAQYEEASPLYGFLKYRRRNVIIKYLPENCSRLIQVRVAVHFQAVCERFAPYNTTFSIPSAKELKDTKLSAACSLHTASSSTSSSTSSLRRRRLMEIAEEEEEEQRATKRQSIVNEEDRPTTVQDEAAPPHSSPPVTLNAQLASFPDEAKFAGTTEPPSFTGADRPPSPATSADARRLSSQLTHSELYSYPSYPYGKPRVKLAPRPSLDVSGRRPRTSAGTGTYRPVSSIPAGFKLFSKGSKRGKENDSGPGDNSNKNNGNDRPVDTATRQTKDEENGAGRPTRTADAMAFIPVPANPPDTLDVKRPHTSGGRPTSSAGLSVKSVSTVAAAASTTKQNTMTPEKLRLMKAMKLREKKRKLGAQPPMPVPVLEPVVPSSPLQDKEDEPFDRLSVTDVSVAGSFEGRPSSRGDLSPNNPSDLSNTGSGDSAIDIGLSAIDRASVDTHTTDSHPTSPLPLPSTKASSLSESTDETIQERTGFETDAKTSDCSDDARAAAAVSVPRGIAGGGTEDDGASTTDAAAVGHGESNDKDEGLPTPASGSYNSREEPTTLTKQQPPVGDVAAANIAKEEDMTTSPASPGPPLPGDVAGVTSTIVAEEPDRTFPVAALEKPTNANLIPAIAVPESRDSQSTIGRDDSGSASSNEARRARRKAVIDPIRTDLVGSVDRETAFSDANLSDDDDLMEELQSATVQEAKPITVSKSPVNPVFPHGSPIKQLQGPNDAVGGHGVRMVSNPTPSSLRVPGDAAAGAARSVSSGGAFLQRKIPQTPANLAPIKKTNLGSSISQRIKALERLSSAAVSATAAEPPARAERPTSTFFSVRKTSGREPSKSPSIAERASSLVRDKRDVTPSPPTSRESSPEFAKLTARDRSGSMASRLSVFESGGFPRGRPESIQVKARIIRDPTQPFPKMPETHFDPSEPGPFDLKQSPLVVDHKKATPVRLFASASVATATETIAEPGSKRESLQERRMSKEKRRSQSQDRSTVAADEFDGTRPRRRSSLSIVRDFIKERRGSILSARSPSTDNLHLGSLASPTSLTTPSKSPSRPPSVHTTSGLVRRLSISSRRSSTSKDRDLNTPPMALPLSPSLMTETSGSGDESKSITSELGQSGNKSGSGNKNRASRFMRRLSSSLSAGRKTAPHNISPTVTEEDEVFSPTPPSRESSAVVQNVVSFIGDVNVQFPDNLLWKRRTMYLDSQGFLLLSTVNGVTATTTAASIANGEKPAGTIKRYHLSDFRLPYIPEMEVQELPNSVCLDFVDGSGLQIACEDRAGQLNVLQTLQEAHQNHTTFGQ